MKDLNFKGARRIRLGSLEDRLPKRGVDSVIPVLMEALESGDPQAVLYLREIDPTGVSIIPTLFEISKNSNSPGRQSAEFALAKYGGAIPALVAAIETGSSQVRERALLSGKD